jgi:D-alanyl-D-alanine carboxypeptidase/D-alanyl-D-alanine-endopeptidase (penicillin-binding protein 4)
MLELLGSGLLSLCLEMAGVNLKPLETLNTLAWQNNPSLVILPDPNPTGALKTQEYLKDLVTSKLIDKSFVPYQGIWLQSGPMLMANHQGNIPLPAASLTKIATSLASLKTWGPSYQFDTLVSTNGSINNGVVNGDLIITANGDPMFVSEEAIAVGNTLNKMGIKQVKGNLVITGVFGMNFQRHPLLAGQLFKQILNHQTWNRSITFQYSSLPKGTPKPQIIINGNIKVEYQPKTGQTILVRHRSLPLQQIIKEMNVYSNNDIAEMLAESLGGAEVVRSVAAKTANVSPSEIILINGSGLGKENKISPRAVSSMFMALQREAGFNNLTLADLFPTSGFDHRGTIHSRKMPTATVMKTGTLNDVSALAGVVPTRDRGLVWFTIINRGSNISAFRNEQDKFLQTLEKTLQVSQDIPASLTPHAGKNYVPQLGAVNRNEVIYGG